MQNTDQTRSGRNAQQQPIPSVATVAFWDPITLLAREYITSAPQMSNSWLSAQTSAISESYVSASAAIAQSSKQASIMSAAAASQSEALEKQKEDAEKQHKSCASGECHPNTGDNLRLHITASLVAFCAVVVAILLM